MKDKNKNGQSGGWEELLVIENKYYINRLFCYLYTSMEKRIFRWIIEKKEKVQKQWKQFDLVGAVASIREVRISLN